MRVTVVRVVALVVAVGLIAYFVLRSFDPHAADFKTFYSAGYAITHPGIPLYDLKELDENPFGQVFKLPPSAAMYLAPLSVGTLQEARLAWRIVLVVAYFASFVLLCRVFGVRALGWAWLGGLAAWAVFAPAQIAVGEGQWDPLLLLALACAAVAVNAGNSVVASLPIAFAASIKLYPALVALYFVGSRSWRALAAFALGFSLLMLLGMAAAGWQESLVFLRQVAPASGAVTAYVDNQAVGGLIARLVTDDLKPFPMAEMPWVDVAIRALAVFMLAGCTWLVWRAPAPEGLDRALQLSLFVPLSIFVIPAAWTHYQTVLLLPLFLLALLQARRNPRWMIGWLMLGIAFVLAAMPSPALIIGEDVDRALWLRSRADAANLALQRQFPDAFSRLVLSYKALGTVLVFALVAWRIARPWPLAGDGRTGRRDVANVSSAAPRQEVVT